MTLYDPNDELVYITWLKAYVTDLAGQVSTSLPRQLVPSGFVTVRSLPIASTSIDVSARRTPILTTDLWAPPAAPGSDKPRWGAAWNLYSLIRRALDNDTQKFAKPLAIPGVGGDTYRPIRVMAVWETTTPRRVENDPNAYAHLTFDVECDWVLA